MWIPKPIYDHAPVFWFLLGALFLAGGIYLNFADGLRAAYYVFATFCFAHAAWTFFARRRSCRQRDIELAEQPPEPVENTES
ncbi:MAG: hypothetical protein OEV10_01155 [Gammaproteobacteria bacterium]|jgi:hypothetical protein|nr:hypothetical protein [Gammaproteobacteria bacterium]